MNWPRRNSTGPQNLVRAFCDRQHIGGDGAEKEVTRMRMFPVMGEVFQHQTRLLLRA